MDGLNLESSSKPRPKKGLNPKFTGQHGREVVATDAGFWHWHACKGGYSSVQVKKLDKGLGVLSDAGGEPRSTYDQRHLHRELPIGVLPPLRMLAKLPPGKSKKE